MSEFTYNDPKEWVPQIGDWVRFYRGGEMVIACVQYINSEHKHYPYEIELLTDEGAVSLSDVLEAR